MLETDFANFLNHRERPAPDFGTWLQANYPEEFYMQYLEFCMQYGLAPERENGNVR